ncbi:ATP-binding protein [Chitinispirillales bacterium ANBcel5]|uniref:two-component system sensor histidine kinase NtrB n=1 Tax=Cellulosispirillum alkaliphilum TaxID=3039283 RepID=UPI002A510BEB|nr:ATP-binding protein [Chitinispirillales bacterium ANBcel5]
MANRVEYIKKLSQELSKARERASLLEQRLQKVNGVTSAIIYELDTNGCFTYINEAVEEILFFTPEELIGSHFSTIMSKREAKRVSRETVLPRFKGKKTGSSNSPKLFDERRTGKRRTRSLEVKLISKKNRETKTFLGDVTGMVDVEGAYVSDKIKNKVAFTGSHGIIFDITKYKQSERHRLEMQKRILEMQKMDAIGKLAGRVAHDLNNKLGSIIGSAELMNQKYGDNADHQLNKYINNILSASKKAVDLSCRLHEFSKKNNYTYATIDAHLLVNNVLEFIKPTMSESITLQKIFAANDSLITGCSNQLQNTFLNLFVNACDAMKSSGGVLTVETSNVNLKHKLDCCGYFYSRPGDYLLISVTDSGCGMDETTQANLFEPFFTTKNDEQSIGLGLTSVRDCIKNHGGFIMVDSKLGQGTSVHLYLPAYQC